MEKEEKEELEERTNGNGHSDEPVGPVIDLADLKNRDTLVKAQRQQNIGVLVRAMTAHPSKEYQQELKLANFQSSDEADDFVAALDECMRLGMDPTPIYNQMLARSAGIKQSLLNSIFDALTHTSFTTNYKKDGNHGILNRNNSPFH